ncbi:hypothetical protein GWI33_002506 [Rhynchophorus ferrugineus]|uniref:Signal transducing adapter molecule 1 n=1 Tax=Rhynchophorus ferrugineus TaxID=354439 RepID=A0A834MN83_RHYFE|nr:hypothetical protein GWI33_002506 [Rhynchophorus ferrugineus]
MGLFGNKADSTIQEIVDEATSDKSVEDNWLKIMNTCDKAGKSSENAKACLRAIVRKLYNSDPHVALKAVTVLDACVKNSGKTFHVEVASRDFENDFTKLMHKAHPHIAKKLRELLKRWADNEFKSDAQLNLIPTLYEQLKNTYDFSSSETPVKKGVPKSTDPNVVESQEEEDDILRAIELSLKETTGSPRNTNTVISSTSLYPSVNNMPAPTSSTVAAAPAPAKEARKVRALYDFEAAEDNELTFSSGEIILILDDSDPNWWKGSNQRGEGLFPANFVTADLTVEPEKFLIDKTKKMVQFKEEVKVLEKEPQEIEVNEDKIDRLLHLLHEADPTNPETDTDELLSLEREVNAMGPLIDSELERVDRKHAQLTQLSANLVEALTLYHTLMREPLLSNAGKVGYEPTYGGYIPPPNGMYNNIPMAGMPQHPPQHLGYQVSGQSSLPFSPHQFPMPQHVHSNTPNTQAAMMPPMAGPGIPNIPQGLAFNQSPANFPPVMEDRRMEGAMMPPQFQQNLPPNYGHLHMAPPQFANSGPVSQTTIQNGPNQPPQFVSSSTHIMQ